MSTRSMIGIMREDGKIEGIYCHHDGYPDGVGEMLKEHYTDIEKINGLIKLGSLSFLGPEIGTEHSFEDRDYNVCMAYGRDRKEEGTEPKMYSVEEFLNTNESHWAEFTYVWQDGEWHMTELH